MNEREVSAYHEAGHCIASHRLGCKPVLITIDAAPRVLHTDDSDATAVAIMVYAASAAATRVGGPSALAGSPDLAMLMKFVSKLSIKVAEAIPSKSRQFVDEHWAEIEELARVVLQRGTLQGDDLAQELARICKICGS